MPLVRIDLRKGKPAAYRAALQEGVYQALRETFEVPEEDRFMLVSEHDADSFAYSRSYLDVARSDDLVMVNITVSATRGVGQKKALYAAIVAQLARNPGLRPEDVLIVLSENKREDWSFGNGVASYVA